MNSPVGAISRILSTGSITALCAAAIAGCASEADPVTRTPGAVSVSWRDGGAHSTTVARADCLRSSAGGVILVESRDLIRRPDGRVGVGVDLRGDPIALIMRPDTGQDTRDAVPVASVAFTRDDRSSGSVALTGGNSLPATIGWQCPN